MAERDRVRAESELTTPETLPSPMVASTNQCNPWLRMGWDVPTDDLHPDRRCPYFRKKVTRGCLHHLPQSVICVPTHFFQDHSDTFRQGNLISLEGPSGNAWKVRATNKPILHSGWRTFAHDHDLREGDLLCFTLTQPSYFVVDVCSRTGDVKEHALTATNTGIYTPASLCYPYEYVHRPRKRRNRNPGIKITANSVTERSESYGYGVSVATIAGRCKTTARDRSVPRSVPRFVPGSGGCNMAAPMAVGAPMGDSRGDSTGAGLRFSHERKHWDCREEKDGREVVTILDSDDDDGDDDGNRRLDHVELSFGSAKVQNYRVSKVRRLMAYVKEQGEFVPSWPNPASSTVQKISNLTNTSPPYVVAKAGGDRRTNATQTIPEHEIAGHGDGLEVADQEQDYVHVDPLTEIQDPEAATEPITCEIATQAQISRDEDTIMEFNKVEEDTHLPKLGQSNTMQLYITPENALCADSTTEALHSHTIPAASQEAPAEIEPLQPVGPRTESEHESEADVDPDESHDVLTFIAAGGSECLFETLQNIVDVPVIADSGNADPIREDPVIPPEPLPITNHNKSQEWEQKQSILDEAKSSASNISKPSEFNSMTKITSQTGDGNIYPLGSKTSTTACVLKSKRMPVAKLHRAKTLQAAQACTKKLRSPNFMAVMKSCNVYTDFGLDIPAEFGKRSRLPAAEAKVTLVCDEVPTMCKAVWIGTDPEKPTLDARAWMEFSRSHFLEEGDVCVFELFNRVTIRFCIHIFRVVGLSRALLPDHTWTQHYHVMHPQHAHQQQPCADGPAQDPAHPGPSKSSAPVAIDEAPLNGSAGSALTVLGN